MKFETYMVSWQVTDITCVIEILLLVISCVWILSLEHLRVTLVHILFAIIIHLLWWHLTSEEIRVDLLVWVNTILLLLHLLLICHHLSLGLIHSRVHASHIVHAWLLFNLLLAFFLSWWLLFGWGLVSWWLVVSFSVHSVK